MNDELKEMLSDIEKVVKTGKDKNDIKVGGICYKCQDLKILLDYITNLQQEKQFVKDCGFENAQQLTLDYIGIRQENERLKDSRDWWKDRFFGQQEYDDSHRITAIEYKKRIDKAIEYIMTELIDEWSIRNQGYVSGSDLPVDAITPLLNILQNGSEKDV